MRKFTKYPSNYVKANWEGISPDKVSPTLFTEYLDELSESYILGLPSDRFDGDYFNGEFDGDWIAVYIPLPDYLQKDAAIFMEYDPSSLDEHGEFYIKVYYAPSVGRVSDVGIWEIGSGGNYNMFDIPWYIEDKFNDIFEQVVADPQRFGFPK